MKELGQMAREAWRWGFEKYLPMTWEAVEAAIRADERAAIEAAGYVVVPREPTDEMIEAGDACDNNPENQVWEEYECGDYDWTEIGNAGCVTHWRAMIAAATPSPTSPVSPLEPGQSDGTSD